MILAGRQRIVAGTAATIEWQPVDQYGEPSDPGAAVTAAVARADGTVVKAAGTATVGSGAGLRTVALTPAETALLDELTATWTVSGVAVGSSIHDVVARPYFAINGTATAPGLRQIETSLGDTTKHTNEMLRRARAEVEAMIEQKCRRAFVRRFSVVSLTNGRGLVRDVHEIRWARTVNSDGTYTAIAAPQYAIDADGVDLLTSYAVTSTSTWTVRAELGVVHGLDAPPADLMRAAMRATRQQANIANSAVDGRVMSQTGPGGEVQRFPTPGVGPWTTGIPDVDETINRYIAVPRARSISVRRDSRGVYPLLRVN